MAADPRMTGPDAIVIRPAGQSDLAAAVRLWRLLQDEHEAVEPRLRRSRSAEKRWCTDYRAWVRSATHAVLVAEVDGEIVGLATAHPYWPAPVYEERLEIYVNELVVDASWRGRGIGRRLVEDLILWAREQGVGQLRAGVLAAKPDALTFWRRVGAEDFVVTVAVPV